MIKFWFLILTAQLFQMTVQVPFQIVPPDYSEDEIFPYLIALYNWQNLSNIFGIPIQDEKPEYWLFTRDNLDLQKLHTWNKTELLQSNFGFTKKTWFIIHGWMSGGYTPAVQELKTALLIKMDVNVIIVDWSKYSVNFYAVCRRQVNKVANRLFKFIFFLVLNGYSLKDVTIVGHSVGGHIAGIAARRLGNELIANIIGVDVAGPLFYDDDGILGKTDAKYVEVLHTSGGILGYLSPIGDTDIFINGGTFQPECGALISMCAHVRGFFRYVETVKNDRDYIAYKCSNYESARTGNCSTDVTLKIGGITPKNWIQGMYYASTADW